MTCSLAPFALFTCWSSIQRRGRRGGEGGGRREDKMTEMSDEGKRTGKGQDTHRASTKTASTPTPSQLAPPPPLRPVGPRLPDTRPRPLGSNARSARVPNEPPASSTTNAATAAVASFVAVATILTSTTVRFSPPCRQSARHPSGRCWGRQGRQAGAQGARARGGGGVDVGRRGRRTSDGSPSPQDVNSHRVRCIYIQHRLCWTWRQSTPSVVYTGDIRQGQLGGGPHPRRGSWGAGAASRGSAAGQGQQPAGARYVADR